MSHPGEISIRLRRAVREKAWRRGSSTAQSASSISVSSQSKPLKKASTAAATQITRVAAQAASRRRLSPKAVSTRARPSTLERKWLSSISKGGAQPISQAKRPGSEGVAPETSSMAPQARVRAAATRGATCSTAGPNPPSRRMYPRGRTTDAAI